MKCPVCTTVNLVMTDRQGVEIDYCPEYRGVWLDRGELDKILEQSAPQASVPPPQSHQQYAPQQQAYANTGRKIHRLRNFITELLTNSKRL